MRMIIEYNGKIYESESNAEVSAEAATDQMCEYINDLSYLKIKLKDGGFAILGKEAIKNCVIEIFDDE